VYQLVHIGKKKSVFFAETLSLIATTKRVVQLLDLISSQIMMLKEDHFF